jgi:hypothetical protein
LDILNGYVLSRRLDCDFVFYWPYDERFPEMEEQLFFFSDDFIQRHRVFFNPEDLNYQFVDFSQMTLENAKKHINYSTKIKYFRNPNFFVSSKFLEDIEKDASNIYVEYAKDSFSSKTLELLKHANNSYSNFEAVHGRFGDLLDGNFNQFVDPRKYIDTLSLAALVKELKFNQNNVVMLTDTPEIARGIEKLENCDLRPINHSSTLRIESNHFEKQTLELLIMASCRTIYAPSLSAFSILGSKIGGNNLKLINSKIENNFEIVLDRKKLRQHYSNFDGSIRKQTMARDLISILQHNWKHFDFKDLKKLILKAKKSDSNYVLALCLASIMNAISSNIPRYKYLMEKAEQQARSRSNIHHDPLILALVTKICFLPLNSQSTEQKIRTEIDGLSPFQFSKQSALFFLDNLPASANESFVSKKRNKRLNQIAIEQVWQSIVLTGEDELLFAMLKLLRLVGFKRQAVFNI